MFSSNVIGCFWAGSATARGEVFDGRVDPEDLSRAEIELASLLHKCEAVLDGRPLSPSRTTLMTNRVAALRTALDLVRRARHDAE